MKSICIDIEQGNLEQLKEVQEILEGMGYESDKSWNNAYLRSGSSVNHIYASRTGTYLFLSCDPIDIDATYTYEKFIELHKPKK